MIIRRHNKLGPVGAFISSIILMAIGWAISFMYALPTMELAKQTLSWPSVNGTIVTSEVTKREDYNKKKKTKSTMYTAEVAYTYYANSRTFTNSAIEFGPASSSTSSSDAYQTVNSYPLGSSVLVYFDPKDPSTSVLKVGVPSSLVWINRIGVGIIVIGALMIFWSLCKLIILLMVLSKSDSIDTVSLVNGSEENQEQNKVVA